MAAAEAAMAEIPLPCRTLVEVAEMLRSREITSEALTQAVLEHIAKHEPRLHAYAALTAESALAEARAADAEIAAAGTTKGPMHGVPIAVKDLYAVAGVQNAGGAKPLLEQVPTEDCTVVKRFRAAGAVILGKLSTTEGAMGGYSEHIEDNIPCNPWNVNRWSGSSSSGSGVAAAAGLAYTTLGSDTGGSIRYPASACGTVGLKPTWGLVSRHGVLDLGQTLDHVGPLCRCTADAAITLQVIAGQDENDPTSLPGPAPVFFRGGADWELTLDQLPSDRPIRIGVDTRYNSEGVDPELATSIDAAIAVLVEAVPGAVVVPCAMPTGEEFTRAMAAWGVLCAPEAAHTHRAAGTWPARKDEYGTSFKHWLEQGDEVTGLEYADARILRDRCVGWLNKMFASNQLDVLACPSGLGKPAHEDRRWEDRAVLLTEKPSIREPHDPHGFCVPWDYSGHPTLTLPCGLTEEEGLPLTFQLVRERSEPHHALHPSQHAAHVQCTVIHDSHSQPE